MDTLPLLGLSHTVVWRTADDLQIGEGPYALNLSGVPPKMKDGVLLFDGRHSMDDLVALLGTEWAGWLVRSLESAHLLDPPPPPVRSTVRVIGVGTLSRQLRGSISSFAQLSHAPTSVVVLAHNRREADRTLTDRLTCARTPHLLVTVTETSACVGPFHLPGITSCVRCVDLAREAIDKTWPLRLFQRMQQQAQPDPILAAWATATASAHVRAYLDGHIPESASSTLTMDGAGRLVYESWPLHPRCTHHRDSHYLEDTCADLSRDSS